MLSSILLQIKIQFSRNFLCIICSLQQKDEYITKFVSESASEHSIYHLRKYMINLNSGRRRIRIQEEPRNYMTKSTNTVNNYCHIEFKFYINT
jgi:hypothetical protein